MKSLCAHGKRRCTNVNHATIRNCVELKLLRRCLIQLFAVLAALSTTYAEVHIEYALPVYSVLMDAADLEFLLENTDTEELFPAVVTFKGLNYDGYFGLRGATSRNLPKKSFQFLFDSPGPGGAYEINLNSEYRDQSVSRNYIAMKLANRLGLPAPDVRHVSLVINGAYFGVYNEIEEVDDLFFETRDLNFPSFMVRAIRHGGAFAPLLDPSLLGNMYDLNETTPAGLDTFAVRRMLLQFGDRSVVAQHSNRFLNLDNIVAFFAMQFAISNLDGMTKNYYLFDNPS